MTDPNLGEVAISFTIARHATGAISVTAVPADYATFYGMLEVARDLGKNMIDEHFAQQVKPVPAGALRHLNGGAPLDPRRPSP